jgi:hypothetical protein
MTKVLTVIGEMAYLTGTETLNILNTVMELQCKYTCLSHKGLQIVAEFQQNSSPQRLIALTKWKLSTSVKFLTIIGYIYLKAVKMTTKFAASIHYSKFTVLEEVQESRGMLLKKCNRSIRIMKYNVYPFIRQ